MHPAAALIVNVNVASPETLLEAALSVAKVPAPDVAAPELVANKLAGVTVHVAVLPGMILFKVNVLLLIQTGLVPVMVGERIALIVVGGLFMPLINQLLKRVVFVPPPVHETKNLPYVVRPLRLLQLELPLAA